MPSSISNSEAHKAKHQLAALAALVVGLMALGLAAWQAMPLSKVSSERYLAAAQDHVDLLASTKGQEGRIVLLGGSGTAFSISAEELSRRFDRTVINGGIQAGIGMRNLIDLYLPYLDPDNDTIVMLPEPELLAGEARYSQIWCDVVYLRKDAFALIQRPRCTPNILHRTWQEMRHHLSGQDGFDPIYRRSGFNGFGDLVSHLDQDRTPPDLSEYRLPLIPRENLDAITDYSETILAARGFDVVYIPSAMPQAACTNATDETSALLEQLGSMTTGAPVMVDVETEMTRFCLSSELFFDGAGHLNADGRKVQTENVAAHLAEFLAR